MATYYVDLSFPTNGTGASFADPFNAFNSLPALSGGDVIEIRGGTMLSTYSVANSGTAGNPITFRGDTTSLIPPTIVLATQGANNISLASRSYITWENVKFEGQISWTNQNTVSIFMGGGGSNIILNNVTSKYARFELAGGFNYSNIQLINCSITDCRAEAFRAFSTIATYIHSNITFDGCYMARNGLAGGSNGGGISFLIQDTHINCNYDNITIKNCVIENNNRAGISINGTGVAWATLIATGNTTPPNQRYRGVTIENNKIKRCGGAGITILGAKSSTLTNVRVSKNIIEDCGFNTTIGGIWTGACLNTVIEYNTIRRSLTNGTVVGDGQGIFDDQWNDGCIVRYNRIENNVFQIFNPFYSSYGIGIYRSANGWHYNNFITGCRQGFFIGYVSGATAPTMSGIIIENNTIVNSTNFVFSLTFGTPASACTIRNNFALGATQDVEAQSGAAGNQTFVNNIAINVDVKYVGNNVPSDAFNHTYPVTNCYLNGIPSVGSILLTSGSSSTTSRDISGIFGNNYVGAYSTTTIAVERGVRV
jgi:hypothetical protein